MDKDHVHVDFEMRTEKPVLRSRANTLIEYIGIIAKQVGLKIKATERETDG